MGGKLTRALAASVCLSAALTAAPAAVPVPAPVRSAADQVQLLATEALIMAGTNMHTINPEWVHIAVSHYVKPALGGEYVPIALITPEEFWPFGGLFDMTVNESVQVGADILQSAVADLVRLHTAQGDPYAPIVAFGYSQSAAVATEVKRRLAVGMPPGIVPPLVRPPLIYTVIGNAYRPNGGIGARFSGLRLPGLTFTGAMPTDAQYQTVDVARQYDPVADFPLYIMNPVAMANMAVAIFYNHNYGVTTLDPTDPAYNPATQTQQYGDTTYYFIPSDHLPLLQPLRDLGVGAKLLDRIEPTLTAWVERGYDRSIPMGQPTKARLFRPVEPQQSPVAVAGKPVAVAGKPAAAARKPVAAARKPLSVTTTPASAGTPQPAAARPGTPIRPNTPHRTAKVN